MIQKKETLLEIEMDTLDYYHIVSAVKLTN